MAANSIKQLEERHVAIDVDFVVWNDKMDLLAIANVKGEVSLHRLIWPKVWTLPASNEFTRVKGMTWRPDGKILAVAYQSGNIVLVDVENKNILHSFEINGGISSIKWIQEKAETKPKVNYRGQEEESVNINRCDKTSKFLSKPSPSTVFSSASKNVQDNNDHDLITNQTEINLLIIGTANGQVHISIFGIFMCAEIHLKDYLNYAVSVISTEMSEDLTLLYITVKDADNHIKFIIIKTRIFKTHADELFAVASKHAHLKSLVAYLTNTLNATTEAWESILLEMDSKLSSYAASVPEGTVAADFLELLMFGTPSTEMEQFLMHDLTEKGLKKMGHSIELSYANIQKLLLKHLTKVGQNVTYHLTELRGMCRHAYRYKAVGLEEALITNAILANGGFLVKSVEMQQVINHSMINYKAFFRWLYVVILRLTDEQIPPEIPKMTQQDLAYITEFLQNLDHIGSKSNSSGDADDDVEAASTGSKRTGFTMERLGQYLEDAALTLPPNVDKNIWEVFLDENECVKEDSCIVEHFRQMSLVQQHKHLDKSINEIFSNPKYTIAKQFHFVKTVARLTTSAGGGATTRFTQMNLADNVTMFAVTSKGNAGIYCLEVSCLDGRRDHELRLAHLYFGATGDVCAAAAADEKVAAAPAEIASPHHRVVDIKFYSADFLSVLLEENCAARSAHMCQLPVSVVRDLLVKVDDDACAEEGLLGGGDGDVPRVDVMSAVSTMKAIEGMVVSHFAVSGSRRVSVVLAENLKKIRLYEMEAEEDEEEDADMTRESDASLQDTSVLLE